MPDDLVAGRGAGRGGSGRPPRRRGNPGISPGAAASPGTPGAGRAARGARRDRRARADGPSARPRNGDRRSTARGRRTPASAPRRCGAPRRGRCAELVERHAVEDPVGDQERRTLAPRPAAVEVVSSVRDAPRRLLAHGERREVFPQEQAAVRCGKTPPSPSRPARGRSSPARRRAPARASAARALLGLAHRAQRRGEVALHDHVADLRRLAVPEEDLPVHRIPRGSCRGSPGCCGP